MTEKFHKTGHCVLNKVNLIPSMDDIAKGSLTILGTITVIPCAPKDFRC